MPEPVEKLGDCGETANGSEKTPGTALIGEVRRAGWRRVARGVYVPAAEPSTVERDAHGWRCLLGDEVTFTGLTGAALRGWWLPTLPRDLPTYVAISDQDPRPRRVGLRVARHRERIPSVRLKGLAAATPAETILSCARLLSLLDLVILTDAALHMGDCTEADLRLAAGQRRRGARGLRRALPMVDCRSESPGETLLRLLHTSSGISVEPQYVVVATDRIIARADLRITGTRRLPEYDGAHHRVAAQYEQDRRREGRLRALGWEPYSYSTASVLREPVRILRDADEALGRPHVPQRIKGFYDLLNASSYTKAGAGQLRARIAVDD
ncbi:MAG: hypothetical protein M3400_13835 [Actinomycetota bacterium]|nr:hypothetical protein [Actinomycetota bacterium]